VDCTGPRGRLQIEESGRREDRQALRQAAVFLDRDGVINRNRSDHVKSWGEFAFLPGSLEALARLARLGWPVVVVSNQGAIGRGLVSRAEVDEIHRRMVAEVTAFGGRIDAVLYCPHHPDEGCDCRKPKPGLLIEAAGRLGLDLSASFLVGDAESDLLAARAAGCAPVIVRTGRGAAELDSIIGHGAEGCPVADDLGAAVEWILGLAATPKAGDRPAEGN
jgi:D-glycero-D-manno-heptose 1,7-bisphosphate phosphatase